MMKRQLAKALTKIEHWLEGNAYAAFGFGMFIIVVVAWLYLNA